MHRAEGRTYVILRIRVRMVSLMTRKTFEMVSVVSLEGRAFRPELISKETLVQSFTISTIVSFLLKEKIHW